MKKSFIWNYFIKINEEKIKCLECNQEFRYKNKWAIILLQKQPLTWYCYRCVWKDNIY